MKRMFISKMEHVEYAQEGEDVMEGGDRSRNAEDEIEPPGDIDDDAEEGEDYGDDGVLLQGLPHAGADHVAAEHLEALARQRLRDDGRYPVLDLLGARVHQLRLQEEVVLARPLPGSGRPLCRRSSARSARSPIEVGRLEPYLEARPAREIDAQVRLAQGDHDKAEQAEPTEDRREYEHLVPQAYEIDMRLLRDLSKFHQMLRLLGLYLASIQSKMVFEPKTAVKRLMMMPMRG